jgi:acyl-CoA thioester hydrolase
MARVRPSEHGNGYVDVPVRVRYADTDRMGIVYNGRYSIYFEVGRTEFMREKGFTYRTFEEMGFNLVVVGMEARYLKSAAYDDLLTVRTTVEDLRSRGLTFRYDIYRDDTLIVEGSTKHICLNVDGKPVMIPSSVTDLLRNAAI